MLIVAFVPPSMLCCCCNLIGCFVNGVCDSGVTGDAVFLMFRIRFESFLCWPRQSEAMEAAFFIHFLHRHQKFVFCY
jgi:hypothetical protein